MAPIERLWVGFGSESGTARALAHRLGAHPALKAHPHHVLPLNEIDVGQLGARDVLLAVSSSFGDGEPPANAEQFVEALRQAPALPGLRYAVFGLGDTAYPQFCGFTKALDALLHARQAQPIMNRVDADASFEDFFARWVPALGEVLAGHPDAGRDLHLQVTAYSEDNAFDAPIVARRRLNTSDPAAWHLSLDLRGSGMVHRAGDTLHVVPENDPALLDALARWYGQNEAIEQLRHKELRQPGKSVLRELARMGGSEALKGLLKVSQRTALEVYLHGTDLLDILQDHATPDSAPLARLVELLSPCLPRAYSIASHGQAETVDLCLREVRYQQRGRERRGAATGWLLGDAGHARVYCRSNPGFHLPEDLDSPLVMVGTGTGIAPLMGLMQEVHATGTPREVCLVFGEKQREHDFLYREVLQQWQAEGRLSTLLTAFSRDTAEKFYVQHALAANSPRVTDLLQRGAHLYVCGNKRHLDGAVQEAIDPMLPPAAGWTALQAQGRVHCELY